MLQRGGPRTKLLVTTLGLLAVLTAGSLLTVRHHFGRQLRQEAAREIRVGSHVLGSIIERSGAQLLDRGRVLAELPSLQLALTKDRRQLEPLLVEVKAVRTANLLWATDASGVTLSSTGEYPALGESLGQEPLVAVALKGQPTLGFDLFGGEWWLVLCLPVKEAKSGQVIGSVSLALLIGEAYLARLSELIHAQVGLVWGEHQQWSEGWPEGVRREVASQLVRGLTSSPHELSPFQEGRFLWLGRPVTGGEPPIAAGPIAVLGVRLDDSVIRRTTQAILWIALLAMILGAFLTVWTVRPILRQLEESQAQLLQVQKVASVGQLAAGVAHELNNPLMVILGNTQLALRMLTRTQQPIEKLRPELTELLQALDQESHRSKTIVSNLLDFVRVRPPAQVPTDLHSLLEESLKLVEHQASLQSVEVERRYAPSLPKVLVDPPQIKQVLLNVTLNAVQAMPNGGKLTFETSATEGVVRVDVRDTGVGISEDQIAKIFDPFYTTKDPGKGTGLGLFICYGIIERHKGTIRAASKAGEGTTLTIELPLSATPPKA